MTIRVECYAGHRGEETPQRFHLGEGTIEVDEVIDRWLAPEHRYFKVRTETGAVYILRHDTETNLWDIEMYVHPAYVEASGA